MKVTESEVKSFQESVAEKESEEKTRRNLLLVGQECRYGRVAFERVEQV
jgi:hypothetical protein